MPDYIDREKMLDCIDLLVTDDGIGYFVVYSDDIKKIPAADVTPIVYGEWIYDSDTDMPRCSACGENAFEGGATPYCPFCGAKMEEDKNG